MSETREEAADAVARTSGELMGQGFHCAESVLLAVARHRGLDSEILPQVATGFCSGMARTAQMCGAVTGGVMAIGLMMGRSSPTQSVDPAYGAVRKFLGDFETRFGSVNCGQLIGCRLDTPEGRDYFKANNLREKCLEFTREAARLAMLAAEPGK